MLINSIMKIVELGLCVGCCECECEHILFKENQNGFPVPVVDEKCTDCGRCLSQCIYNPENDD